MKTPSIRPLGLAAALACAIASSSSPLAAKDLDLLHTQWPSTWITCPDIGGREAGVYHFRKTINLTSVPAHYVVHVSADNRFILFVNGARIGDGPARADLQHWRYETFDIASSLKVGANVIGSTVWNCGGVSPVAQISDQTAFLVQGDTEAESEADTGKGWQVEKEMGQGFLPTSGQALHTYYAGPPQEFLDAGKYDWDWMNSTTGWKPAVDAGSGEPGRYPMATPVGTGSGIDAWLLVPDPLPHMAYSPIGTGHIVRVEGADNSTTLPATIPAHSKVSILTDWGVMTSAYPNLAFGRGKGSTVRITYSEALVDDHDKKGNRSEIAGRHITGVTDVVSPDGSQSREWSPLWWRAWRFVQVTVETGDEPLDIKSLTANYSGYPFEAKGSFSGNDPVLAKIWEVGSRTARMNAHETYSDCPYYEQLQYLGDTRIQALISYVSFGDDRLARQALDAYDQSRIPEGLSLSRYPASLNQVIPTFSLLWIGMIHDYWLYRPDASPVRAWVEHSRSVLRWYKDHQRGDGLLGLMPWWNYADWTKDFDFGVPPQDADGGSSVLTLHYLAALRDSAELEDYLGNTSLAADYRSQAKVISASLYKTCWDEARGILADTPAHQHFSEEANALAVLLDVVPKDHQQQVMGAVLAHKAPGGAVPTGEFSPASLYFKFYVARALDHAGMADQYLDTLGPWRGMLDNGLTTWAETADPTRSDDHAWSAHPNYDLITLVAGIRPAAAGFERVVIIPHPGKLTEINATLPLAAGDLTAHYVKSAEGWSYDVTLPPGMTGWFLWDGHTSTLVPGPNHLGVSR